LAVGGNRRRATATMIAAIDQHLANAGFALSPNVIFCGRVTMNRSVEAVGIGHHRPMPTVAVPARTSGAG